MTAEYRVSSRHGTTAASCLRDAKTAMRWARSNAKRLGIDPNRLAAGGGSAGGHLAAALGTIVAFEEPYEDLSFSSVPNALALFNPAVVLAPIENKFPLDAERIAALGKRLGTLSRSAFALPPHPDRIARQQSSSTVKPTPPSRSSPSSSSRMK